MPASSWLTKFSDGEWSIAGLLDRVVMLVFPPTLKLAPLEKRLIAEVLSKLPSVAAIVVERQMAEYNLVQRDGYKKWTHFYSIKRGKEGFPDELRFPSGEDFKFASIKFRVPGIEQGRSVNFWAMGGRFFRMTFSDTIKDIMNRDDIEILNVKVRPTGLIEPLPPLT